jgi:hypothetical protein
LVSNDGITFVLQDKPTNTFTFSLKKSGKFSFIAAAETLEIKSTIDPIQTEFN